MIVICYYYTVLSIWFGLSICVILQVHTIIAKTIDQARARRVTDFSIGVHASKASNSEEVKTNNSNNFLDTPD